VREKLIKFVMVYGGFRLILDDNCLVWTRRFSVRGFDLQVIVQNLKRYDEIYLAVNPYDEFYLLNRGNFFLVNG
jgi:hypothetical protein